MLTWPLWIAVLNANDLYVHISREQALYLELKYGKLTVSVAVDVAEFELELAIINSISFFCSSELTGLSIKYVSM